MTTTATPPTRRLFAMGSTVSLEEARLSKKAREAVRQHRACGGHDSEAIAWRAIHAWEQHTGRVWDGDTPTGYHPPAA